MVEYQELAEVKQEELNMIQAQQEEGERETSEEMDIIHHRMEEVEAQHQSDINKYKARIQELEKMSETDKKAFLEGFKTKELELKEKIKVLFKYGIYSFIIVNSHHSAFPYFRDHALPTAVFIIFTKWIFFLSNKTFFVFKCFLSSLIFVI